MKLNYTRHKNPRFIPPKYKVSEWLNEIPFNATNTQNYKNITKLYPHQRKVWDELMNGNSVHVTKARQIGMTTLALEYAYHRLDTKDYFVLYIVPSGNMATHIRDTIKWCMPFNRRLKIVTPNSILNSVCGTTVDTVIWDECEYIPQREMIDIQSMIIPCKSNNFTELSFSSIGLHDSSLLFPNSKKLTFASNDVKF